MPNRRRRPTSADVASRAGVSRTTVSLVLNDRTDSIPESTRQRVFDAAQALGYHPDHSARGLAGGRTHTLALILRQTAEQVAGDALLAETLRGYAAAARSAGFRVLVEPLSGDMTSGELVSSGRSDCAVFAGPLFDDPELGDLVAEGVPIVVQGHQPGLGAPSVDIDNVECARLAVEHLIELGHRRIACITNAPLAYTAAADRLAGYREAIADAGLLLDAELVAEGAFDAPSGHRAMAEILARTPDVDAVFVASDVVALGAISALREAGRRVPDDVSVIGFDDIPLAPFFDPPLTSVRLPAHELGLAAGRALLDRIAGRDVPDRTLLASELIVRASTAPPQGRG